MNICPIMMDEIVYEYVLRNCNHLYEKDAIKEWIWHNINNSIYPLCPMCRTPISIYDIIMLHIVNICSYVLKKSYMLSCFVFLHPCVFMSLFINKRQYTIY